ncbi:MAG TPA: arginine--tRNA ligase [Polyangiaceae bacterium]|nr:arginine--tRNA ligase [Polyangiaceae bacterium]
MRDIQATVEDQLRQATRAALGEAFADTDPMVRVADPQFGDFQANLALSLAKTTRKKPRDIAQAIADQLARNPVIARVEVAGPGFINLTLSEGAVVSAARAMWTDPRLGVEAPSEPQRVVVDYGSPNLAKEMHIGHLRSSIIGDAISRILRFAGHDVLLQNHIGDWGTQFGMLLEHLLDAGWDSSKDHTLADLNDLYRDAKARFDAETEFADRARLRVVKLQAGDAQSLEFWNLLIEESCAHMNDVFGKLGVLLRDEDLRGESFYNTRLAGVVGDLRSAGVLEESDGAQVVFCEGFTSKGGSPLPLIVQKSDGGYGYAATDLAAARFRIGDLNRNRLIYVVDSRQSDHFGMLFWTLRRAGWAPPEVSLEHVAFGTILGADRKAFKTRAGGTVKLADVLDEAVSRARAALVERGRDLDPSELDQIARAVGVGAVKYADLSSDRIKDYTFDYDRMLAMEGNTAPYLQYAYVRVQSILRKADPGDIAAGEIAITDPIERELMLELLELPRLVAQLVSTLEPHRLCTYLYELASRVHQFHERCPVLKAPDAATRQSRLVLSALAGRTLKLGLELLGVTVVERM